MLVHGGLTENAFVKFARIFDIEIVMYPHKCTLKKLRKSARKSGRMHLIVENESFQDFKVEIISGPPLTNPGSATEQQPDIHQKLMHISGSVLYYLLAFSDHLEKCILFPKPTSHAIFMYLLFSLIQCHVD